MANQKRLGVIDSKKFRVAEERVETLSNSANDKTVNFGETLCNVEKDVTEIKGVLATLPSLIVSIKYELLEKVRRVLRRGRMSDDEIFGSPKKASSIDKSLSLHQDHSSDEALQKNDESKAEIARDINEKENELKLSRPQHDEELDIGFSPLHHHTPIEINVSESNQGSKSKEELFQDATSLISPILRSAIAEKVRVRRSSRIGEAQEEMSCNVHVVTRRPSLRRPSRRGQLLSEISSKPRKSLICTY